MPPLVITKTVDEEHLKIADQLLEEALQEALMKAAGKIDALARRYTPVRSGKLLAGFSMTLTERGLILTWTAKNQDGKDYASIVEVGADPHVINPRGHYPLKFPAKGGQLQKAGRPGLRVYVPPRDGYIRSWGHMVKGYAGKFYGETTGNEGILILQEELAAALERQEWAS